jgi:hypothetical protein
MQWKPKRLTRLTGIGVSERSQLVGPWEPEPSYSPGSLGSIRTIVISAGPCRLLAPYEHPLVTGSYVVLSEIAAYGTTLTFVAVIDQVPPEAQQA